MTEPVHVIGATGRTGAVLCRLMLARGTPIIPVVRDPARWAALGIAGVPRIADLTDLPSLQVALADATRVVSVSFAAWTAQILAAAPETARLVLTGTARRYGSLEDPAARDAGAAEALLLASRRDAAMLHPTMIYGAPDDGTVSRLAGLLRRTPVLPLPGGGRALVQPVHVDDLAACLIAALDQPWPAPQAIPIGGPESLPYAAFAREVARAANLHPRLILTLPDWLTHAAGQSLLRLLEDRDVDTSQMRYRLGITGRPLRSGLAQMFGAI
jgi:uncharacterized protein YbjT (DUF2867 family)